MTDKLILLVEDNPDDEELTLLALRESRVLNSVVVVHDGLAALDYLFGTGKYAGVELFTRPQLILLDLKLPKMGGLEVLQRLRSNPDTALIPVVVLTSSTEQDDLIASYRVGANSFVRKPVEFHSFSEAVQRVGMYWLLINEPAIRRT